ncbi:MAG: 2-dehydropantoate 2-reductase N-terminal domain-containing protein, partial [Pseudomonadota bacterium]
MGEPDKSQKYMAINVVGAGAIGCFVGGVLAANGCRVTLLGRPWLAKDIAENGLTVTTLDGQTQHVPADDITLVMDAAALPPADATLICTKSDDTAAAAESLAQNMAQLGQVYSLQNG